MNKLILVLVCLVLMSSQRSIENKYYLAAACVHYDSATTDDNGWGDFRYRTEARVIVADNKIDALAKYRKYMDKLVQKYKNGMFHSATVWSLTDSVVIR